MFADKCERCGVYTDDGGTRLAVIAGELRRAWLCPECFAEDDPPEDEGRTSELPASSRG